MITVDKATDGAFTSSPCDCNPMNAPLATHDYAPGGLSAALEFLKRTRNELRMLRRVRVWKDRLHVIDVNKDCFEMRGVGYGDADIVPLLQNLNTAFNPETIHDETDAEYKEFGAGKRLPVGARPGDVTRAREQPPTTDHRRGPNRTAGGMPSGGVVTG